MNVRAIRFSLALMLLILPATLAFGQTPSPSGAPATEKSTEKSVQKERAFSLHPDFIPAVAFSPDGKRFASAGENRVKLTDVETGNVVLTLKNSDKMRFRCLAYSPDGQTLAGGQVRLKEASSRRQGDLKITTLTYHGEILVWDAQTGVVKAKLNDADDPVWAMAFSPDGKWLAIATGPTPDKSSQDCDQDCPVFGEVLLWDTSSWKLIRRLKGGTFLFKSLAFSPDSQTIAAGAGIIEAWGGEIAEKEDRFEIFLWDMTTRELKQKLPGHLKAITALSFSPDGAWLASAGRDGELKFWNSQTYQLKRSASEYLLSLEEMQTIAEGGGKNSKRPPPLAGALNAIAFSQDGKHLIGGGSNDVIRFYDVDTAKINKILTPRGWPFSQVSRPPVRLPNSRPAVWDSSQGTTSNPRILGSVPPLHPQIQKIREWQVPVGMLNSMALSPNGKMLALGNADGKVRLLVLE